MTSHTFGKQEHLCSTKLIDQLFGGVGSSSMAAFPLRVVWMETVRQAGQVPVQVLISVSKRRLRHAVARNRVKRQIREAYRLNKQLLTDTVSAVPDRAVAMAFIWLSDGLYGSDVVSQRVAQLLRRMSERMGAGRGEATVATAEAN